MPEYAQPTNRAIGPNSKLNTAIRNIGDDVGANQDLLVSEEHTIANGDKVTLFDGDVAMAIIVVINTDDDETATYFTQGSETGVTQLAEPGTDTWGTSEGETDQNQNIFFNTLDNPYQLENQSGGEKTYKVAGVRVA